MHSTTIATAPARRSAMLPLGIALLVAASYAAGVLTPSIVGSATIPRSDSATVTQAQQRQGPPDDQAVGAKLSSVQPRQGPPDDQIP